MRVYMGVYVCVRVCVMVRAYKQMSMPKPAFTWATCAHICVYVYVCVCVCVHTDVYSCFS